MDKVKEHRIVCLRRMGVSEAPSRPPGEAREVLHQVVVRPLVKGRMGGRSALCNKMDGLPAAHAR